MAYVEAGCDRCGLILPKLQLRDWKEDVEIERTSAVQGTYSHGGEKYTAPKSTFRVDHLKLCPDCYIAAKEALEAENARKAVAEAALALEREREQHLRDRAIRNETPMSTWSPPRKRRGRGLWWAIGILAALLIAGSLFARLSGRSASQEGSTDADTVTDPRQVSVSPDQNTERNSSADEPPMSAHPPVEPAAAEETPSIPTPDSSPALGRALASALEDGSAKPWQDGSHSGQVTVGEERFYNGRPCRSFAYTANGATSPTGYSCAGADGVWRPTADFNVKGLY